MLVQISEPFEPWEASEPAQGIRLPMSGEPWPRTLASVGEGNHARTNMSAKA